MNENTKAALAKDFATAINRHNAEAGSNTPDFILANYLVACLEAFSVGSCAREGWYNWHCYPGREPTRKAT